MPNRILKESICSSEDIDNLKPFEETVFYRLIVNCDDYGRLDARPAFLKSKLFVTKQGITVQNVEDAILKLASVGLVQLYTVNEKPFLQFSKWELHQQIRTKKSKFPAPDNNGYQMISNDIKCSFNPIQSESESKSESNLLHGAETPPCSNMIISLTLNDKSEFPIFEKQIQEWTELYPAVDILQELRKMKGWIDSNPQKRKTKTGILRFITSWLGKAQDKGGNVTSNSINNQSLNNQQLTGIEKLRQRMQNEESSKESDIIDV